MKTNITTGFLTDKISEGFKKMQQEIEEFGLQVGLGKMEAAEKFEELKKEFSTHTREWKRVFEDAKSEGQEKAASLAKALEEIQLQLTLGKADAKDFFAEQKKKLLDSVYRFENELKESPHYKERLNEFRHEMEKFKLKLEILELQIELKSMEGKDKFKKAMANANIEIEKVLMKAGEKWDDAKKKSSGFSDEIAASFEHLKKAVKSLKN